MCFGEWIAEYRKVWTVESNIAEIYNGEEVVESNDRYIKTMVILLLFILCIFGQLF